MLDVKFPSHLTNNTTCEFQNIDMNDCEYRHIINNNDSGGETMEMFEEIYHERTENSRK